MGRLTKLYCKILDKHMLLVQSLQAGILMGTGDLIAQTCIEKRKISHLHYHRTGEFFLLGTCLVVSTV